MRDPDLRFLFSYMVPIWLATIPDWSRPCPQLIPSSSPPLRRWCRASPHSCGHFGEALEPACHVLPARTYGQSEHHERDHKQSRKLDLEPAIVLHCGRPARSSSYAAAIRFHRTMPSMSFARARRATCWAMNSGPVSPLCSSTHSASAQTSCRQSTSARSRGDNPRPALVPRCKTSPRPG